MIDLAVRGEFIARLATAERSIARGENSESPLRELLADATRRGLTRDDEIILRIEKSLVQSRSRSCPAIETSNAYRALRDRCAGALGEGHRLTRSCDSMSVRYARYAGVGDWRASYEEQIRDAEQRHGKYSRPASIKRSNLAVALNEYGMSDEDRKESYKLANAEWEWRKSEFGEENPFCYVALENALNAGVRAIQYGKPIVDPRSLLRLAQFAFDRRQQLLGSQHTSTLAAFIQLQVLRAELGEPDARWQLLTVLDELQPDGLEMSLPERMPIALCRAFGLGGDRDFAMQWFLRAKEILVSQYGSGSPRTVGALALLQRALPHPAESSLAG